MITSIRTTYSGSLLALLVLALVSLAATPVRGAIGDAVGQPPAASAETTFQKSLRASATPLLEPFPNDAPVALASLIHEREPNDSPAEAMELTALPAKLRADLFRTPSSDGTDIDVYRFEARPGDRLFAATMTQGSSGSTDTLIEVLRSDGSSIVEVDDDDGAYAAAASTVAGVPLTDGGTYFLRVSQAEAPGLSGTVRPYDLYINVVFGAAAPETEPNELSSPQPLPAGGWVSGTIGPTAGDVDAYAVDAQAGDTVVAILDIDPERDAPEWNARVGVGPFRRFFLLADGSTVGGASDDDSPSEAMFMTVGVTGRYQVFVDHPPPGGGSAAYTYALSVFVVPADRGRSYHVVSGTGSAIEDAGVTRYALYMPQAGTIGNLRVRLNATHPALGDLDVTLTSPDGNEVVLFDDVPAFAGADPPQIDVTLDDEAAVPISTSGAHADMRYTPEAFGRLVQFEGMQAQGNWTLSIYDDTAGSAGTLHAWALEFGEATLLPPCALPETVEFTTDFENGHGGFSHTGTRDDWQHGTPVSTPIASAHSGARAWKTDLDGSYDANSNQDLLSPVIDLSDADGRILVSWWQKHRIQSASADSAWIEVGSVVDPEHTRRLWEWKGATQTRSVGISPTPVQISAGWARRQYDISDFAGTTALLRFHLESDDTTQLTGLAIDDVVITRCPPTPAALEIEPRRIEFGSHVVGDSVPSRDVTMSNPGEATLLVTALEPPAAPFVRDGGSCSHSLPFPLAGGAECTLSYTFQPTVRGDHAQPLQVTASAPASTGGTIELTGTALQGYLRSAPVVLEFGDQPVDTNSQPLTLVLTNDGDAPLTILTLDAVAAPFSRTGGDCAALPPMTLAAGAGCAMEYTFAPAVSGRSELDLHLEADVPGGERLRLSGRGVQAMLEITPKELSFGDVNLGDQSANAEIALRNVGDAPLVVQALSQAEPPFARTQAGSCGNALPLRIETGASCTLSYRFAPFAVGRAQRSYALGSNAGGDSNFQMQGVGQSPGARILADGFEGGASGARAARTE